MNVDRGVKFSIILLVALDILTFILLVISMIRIHTTIKTYFPKWKPNMFFLVLQVIAFSSPVLMTIGCVLLYKPQVQYSGTLTYDLMLLSCLFQISISIVMIALLYVVTKYSLSQVQTEKKSLIYESR